MTRIGLVVLERDLRAVLLYLSSSGAIQLVQTQAGPETAPLAPRSRAAERVRCERILARVEALRRSLELRPAAETPGELPALTLSQAEEQLSSLEQRAGVFLRRRQHLLDRCAKVTTEQERVSSYRGVALPLEEPDRNSFLHFITGTLPTESFERVQSRLAESVALLPMPSPGGGQRVIALTTRRGRAALERVLQEAGFEPEPLPAIPGATTDSLFESSERDRERLSAELQQMSSELGALAEEYSGPLARIEGFAEFERGIFEAEQSFLRTEAAIWISGWAPRAEATVMESQINQITGSRCAVQTGEEGAGAGDQTPVLLRHHRLLRPFELLVKGYGLPAYGEVEPTLFVAVSYILMFGMMFGDAGQGAVLALAGLAGLVVGRKQTIRDMGLLLLFGGLSSMAFGLIYGSCFGLPAFKARALWHDPLEGDPMTLMYCAMGLGIVMISLGLGLNIVNRFRRGDVIGALLDKFGLMGVLFYWGVLVLLTNFEALRSRGLVPLALIAFLAVPMVGWALKEPIEYFQHHRTGPAADPGGGLFTAFTESVVGAFEAVLSYLANTISFVRLAAYAMSHAALLVAAFMLAAAVEHISPAGGMLSVLAIVAGNIIAILLEGIIASVQALRLEYYEFFGKFFSGTGRPFEPFRLAASQT